MTKKIPEIRFKGFDGEWEEKKLGDIATITMGQSPNSKNYTIDAKYPVLIQGNQDIKNGKIYPRIYTKEITKLADINDIILTVRAPVGEVAINRYNSVIGRGVCSIKANLFIFYDLYKKKYYYWDKFSSGSTFKAINSSDIKKSNIVIPNLKLEQDKIGSLFEKIDSLIEGQAGLVDSYKGLKKSLLQKMFPKEGEKIPQIRFPGFDGEWKEIKISDIFQLKRGEVLSKKEIKDKIEDDYKYPVYSSQTLNNGILGYFNRYLFEDCITRTTDGANAGTVKFREGRFYSTNVNGVLISDKGYSNQAVAEALNRVAYRYVSKVGNPKLMNNVMSDINISLPSLPEQKKIGDFFKKLDNLIEDEEKYLEDLKVFKKVLLQKMFV